MESAHSDTANRTTCPLAQRTCRRSDAPRTCTQMSRLRSPKHEAFESQPRFHSKTQARPRPNQSAHISNENFLLSRRTATNVNKVNQGRRESPHPTRRLRFATFCMFSFLIRTPSEENLFRECGLLVDCRQLGAKARNCRVRVAGDSTRIRVRESPQTLRLR
jgi:hypothetical protein